MVVELDIIQLVRQHTDLGEVAVPQIFVSVAQLWQIELLLQVEVAEEVVGQVPFVVELQTVTTVVRDVLLMALVVVVEHKLLEVMEEHLGQVHLLGVHPVLLVKEVKADIGKLPPAVVVAVDCMAAEAEVMMGVALEQMAAVAAVQVLRLYLQVEHVLPQEMVITDMLQLQYQLYLEYLQPTLGLIVLDKRYS